MIMTDMITNSYKSYLLLVGLFFTLTACAQDKNTTDMEWRDKLTEEQYRVLREKGTERAWTGALLDNKEKGTYVCAGCGNPLFSSDTKYDSGSGWPSFYDALSKDAINEHKDTTHGMVRVEITCKNCDGHLGHVFPDGPRPTGMRYCVNSISLEFKKDSSEKGSLLKE